MTRLLNLTTCVLVFSGLCACWGAEARSDIGADEANAILTGSSATASVDAADTVKVNEFMAYVASDSSIDLKLWAGYRGRNSAWNFDGYYNGNATIAVPLDWRIEATFQNLDANVVHSAGIIESEQPVPATGSEAKIAFEGAASTSFVTGVTSREKPETFSFRASREGEFMVFCGVPGHGRGGMWIWFEVSSDLSAPEFRTE